MGICTLTAADKRFIKKNRLKISAVEMGKKIGQEPESIRSWMRIQKINVPKKLAAEFRKRGQLKSKQLAAVKLYKKHDAYIKRYYLKLTMVRMAKKLGTDPGLIKRRMKAHGLVVPPAIKHQRLSAHGAKSKGCKMSEATKKKLAHTFFKPGHKLTQAYKVGTIIYCQQNPGKNGPWYKQIKLITGWKLYHRHVWEKKHGPVPAGHVVTFKDGDSRNCRITNLMVITHAQAMARNTIQRFPKELQGQIKALSLLTRKINNVNNEKRNTTTSR